MNRPSLAPRLALAALLALVCADARAVRRTEDPIALVPADAATVGVLSREERGDVVRDEGMLWLMVSGSFTIDSTVS